jgi:hypothetical protein
MSQGPVKFQSTVVRPYLTEQPCQEEVKMPEELQDKEPQKTRREQGRPKGSRNRQRTENNKLCRSERHLITEHDDQFIAAIEKDNVSMAFMTRKEQADMELAIKLRKDGVITRLGNDPIRIDPVLDPGSY